MIRKEQRFLTCELKRLNIIVNMLKSLGCQITGDAMDFYRQPVIPIRINKSNFTNAGKKGKCFKIEMMRK